MNLDNLRFDDPIWWLAGGGLTAFLFSLTTGSSWQEAVLVSGIGAIVGVVLWLIIADRKPATGRYETRLRPPAVRTIVRDRFGRAPWTLARDDPDELLYWRPVRTNLAIVIVLLLLGIWPAVVYRALCHGRTQTLVIRTQPDTDGAIVHFFAKPSHPAGHRIFNQLVTAMENTGLASDYGFDELRD